MRDRTRLWDRLEKSHYSTFAGQASLRRFTAPGRTELGGNHTDHNQGKVLAAAIHLEASAVAEPCDGPLEVFSEGWKDPFVVALGDLNPQPKDAGTSTALIRGVASEFVRRGYRVGGFRATIESSVLSGSGLSSSAAFEILVGVILSTLYNDGKVPLVEVAKIGQAAENLHFGKPCGLMDQMSSALGGVVAIDFRRQQTPEYRQVEADFAAEGWALFIVNTGGSHADLTPDYAAVPAEMRQVAKHFGHGALREVSEQSFYDELPVLFRTMNHRALLRAIHFFEENHRVDAMVQALEEGRIRTYLDWVNASGRSSAEFLQNTWSPRFDQDQGLNLGLALTERFLAGEGACRVHGGGFAGTIQAYVPLNRRREYVTTMEAVFGAGTVVELNIRPEPAGEV